MPPLLSGVASWECWLTASCIFFVVLILAVLQTTRLILVKSLLPHRAPGSSSTKWDDSTYFPGLLWKLYKTAKAENLTVSLVSSGHSVCDCYWEQRWFPPTPARAPQAGLYTADANQGLSAAAVKVCCWKPTSSSHGFSVFWRCACHSPTPCAYPLPSSHLRTTVYLSWAVVSLLYENVLSLLYPENSLKCGFFWKAFPKFCFPFLCSHSTNDAVILGEVIVSLPHKPEGTPCALVFSQGLKKGLKHGGHPVASFDD